MNEEKTMTPGPIVLSATLLLALLMTFCVKAEDTSRIKRVWISAPITVTADGQATIGEVTDVKGALAQTVHEQLSKVSFLPARNSGASMTSTAHVAAALVLTPVEDDRYAVGIQYIQISPLARKLVPALYPASMARKDQPGHVELLLRIGADGKAQVSRTIAASHPDFEKAAIEAVKNWQFEPQTMDGVPVAIEIAQPFWFRSGKPGEAPLFQCPWDERRPRAEEQSGCFDVIEITMSRVRRQTIY
jgi:TonB family protein